MGGRFSTYSTSQAKGAFTLEEFESFLCAALLHDIGKFYQRAHNQKVRHWDLSAAFIEANRGSFYNPDLAKTLVSHHHESSAYTDKTDRPESISDASTRMLAYLVSRADNLSSRERPESDKTGGYMSRAALDSVFAQVDIGQHSDAPYDGSNMKHRLGTILCGSGFPEPLGGEYEHAEAEFEEYVDRFLTDFRELFPQPYPRMADTLAHLLQKYLWCIPSDVTRERRDISLADHSRVTAALAACFYRYHEETGWGEGAVCDDSLSKVSFVCGDLSGIQDYIYGTASVGHGGVAKRLRGRSFRITLLTEAVVLRILRKLDLPMACKIMSAGGQFYLLIPNTQNAKSRLKDVIRSISAWLLDNYLGELAISVACEDLAAQHLSQGNFDEVLGAVHATLAGSKLRKFEEAISEGPHVFPLEFQGLPACPTCDRRPAQGNADEAQPCRECESDADLGRRLVECGWLVFSEKYAPGGLDFFDEPTWYASVVRDPANAIGPETICCYNLWDAQMIPNTPSGFAFYASYVPTWQAGELDQTHRYRKYLESQPVDDVNRETAEVGDIKSFTALAMQSCGDDLLGVLRADVDHLGLVFSLGMRARASLSRIATLSTMLNVFFSSELVRLIRKDYPDTYIAYSGGDDLLLVGPWDRMVSLSKRIADEFHRFAARNPNITLSAGVGTFRPRVPIATTAVQTGEILEHSKSAGRNRLTLFGTTITWDEFDDLKKWADMLSGSLQREERGISRAFLYRLFRYQRQACHYLETGDPQSLLYRPHLAYDIARNYTDEDGGPKLADRELHEALLSLLEPGQRAEKSWKTLQAAITWSSYATRKEE